MSTLSLMTEIGAAAGTVYFLYDKNTKNINKQNAKVLATSISATAATAIVGGSLNNMTVNQLHNKYASAYVESMSDEELERALEKMDLLVAEQTSETDVKTI